MDKYLTLIYFFRKGVTLSLLEDLNKKSNGA